MGTALSLCRLELHEMCGYLILERVCDTEPCSGVS